MTRHLAKILIILGFIYSGCKERFVHQDPLFFNKNELSDDKWIDSLQNQRYSEELRLLGEESLKDTSSQHETIRLTVPKSIIYNAYCIRLDKVDSMYIVSFKEGPDPKDLRRTGLNGLTLTYKSDFVKMDSIYKEIIHKIYKFDIFAHDNSTPEIVIQNKIVGADGIEFLLEFYTNGRHIALTRWDGFLEPKYYKKSGEFMDIVNEMHLLVPSELLPDYLAAREIDEVRFPIFKKKK